MLSVVIVGDLLFFHKLHMSGVLISIVDRISTLKHSMRELMIAICCAFELLETRTGTVGASGLPDRGQGLLFERASTSREKA